MPGGGSKPGQRRGGRPRGSLNKATIERLQTAERDVIEARASGRKLAKEVLEDFMLQFAGMAAFYQPTAPNRPEQNEHADPVNFEKYARLAIGTAADLAPYQSPTFKAIAVVAPPAPVMIGGEVINLEHAIEMDVDDPIQVSRVYRFIMAGEVKQIGGRRKPSASS